METIQEHTALLLQNYDLLKGLYPGIGVDWEVLRLAVLFHDLGKVNTKFQNKLYKHLQAREPGIEMLEDKFPAEEEIPHGNLSPAFLDRVKLLEDFDEDTLNILYQAIYYHHPRLLDRERFEFFKQTVAGDLTRYAGLLPEGWELPYYRTEPLADFNRYTRNRIGDGTGGDLFHRYVKTKGLLNRLDYAASAHIEVEVPNRDLERKTLDFLEQKGGPRDIQRYLLARQQQNNLVVASTGIGKTEAGLLWTGNNKGFFTLPLRVSINAIYKRIKHEDIGFGGAALLHSDALSVLIKTGSSDDYFRDYEKARLLAAPLTITTVDQLFKFVFKEEGFESILATLSYSRVIIDEIQMYSPEIAACILMGIKYITEAGGKFSILTATFPPVLEYFLKEKLKVTDYEYKEFLQEKTRHRVEVIDGEIGLALGEIAAGSRKAKVLVIVNTVKMAQALFKALPEDLSKHLLHSRFIKRDRARLEKCIMNFSKTHGRTGVWIATQVVEASLDIDFDYLYTELSTIDGLFQRMGRCFRQRELCSDMVNVRVYTGKPSGIGKVVDEDIFKLSKEALRPFHGKSLPEKEKLALVKEVYSLDKIKATNYYKEIKDRLEFLAEIPAFELKRSEVEEKFRNIRSYTVIPISIYNRESGRIGEILDRLRELGFSPQEKLERVKLLEEIKDLTVDVPAYMGKDIVEEVKIDRYHRVNITKLAYDGEQGLLTDEESNIL